MAALTKSRNTLWKEGSLLALGVAVAKKIWQGSLVALDANGYAAPGATATTLKGLGMAVETVDNTGGNNGDKLAIIRTDGAFLFANSASDPVAAVDITGNCFIVDDQTVAKTDGSNTRSIAGTVFDVDDNGVWIKFQ